MNFTIHLHIVQSQFDGNIKAFKSYMISLKLHSSYFSVMQILA